MSYLKINDNDNVKILLKSDDKTLSSGHKVASTDIKKNEKIIKYGSPIGIAIKDIKQGEHVHTQNVKTLLEQEPIYAYHKEIKDVAVHYSAKSFHGYLRDDGEVGIRNHILILPTVGCVNRIARNLEQQFLKKHRLEDIDGVFSVEHPYGCSQMGDDHATTKAILANIVKNPNFGGVLIIGLGCENNQITPFMEALGPVNGDRIKTMIVQNVDDEYAEGLKLLEQIYAAIQKDKRSPQPLSKLKIGLECGGSDGLSGVTANPLVGKLSDYIIHYEGTSVLSEVPEMFGAEHILMNRCIDEIVFKKTEKMIKDFKNYYTSHGQVVYENPSPGNKNGGITTLEDKSLGCIEKSGSREIVDVLGYTERLKTNGLNLLTAPGNDPICTTALVSSGCQIVVFTTGRGTPYGGIVPTVKVSSNTALYEKKKNWIDYNAGKLITEDITFEECSHEFIDYIIDVCSGEPTCNEKNGMREIAIWKTGVTL